MLWRPAYEPRELTQVELPPLAGRTLEGAPWALVPGAVLLGAFDARAQSELGVWRRLFQSEAIVPAVVFFSSRPERTRRDLLALVPPTQHGATAVAEDSERRWEALIQPDRPERSFAAIAREGKSPLVTIGTPTEEAWDRFLEALRA